MKILIRATNWVGDAIMALPALRSVRARFPEAHVAIVARPYVADIYRDQQVCDQLIPYDLHGAHASFSGRAHLPRELRAQKFDVALLLQNAFDAAWLAWRAGIPERIGYARDGRSFLLTKAVPVPKPGEIPAHEQFYYLELLRRAGWLDHATGESYIVLNIDSQAKQHAEERLLAAGARSNALRVAIGAGASYGSAKCWPPDRFAEVANRLVGESDADIILFGTPANLRCLRPSLPACAARPLISPEERPSPIFRRFSLSAISLSATIRAPCTWLPRSACQSSQFSAPPILMAPRQSLHAAPSCKKSPTVARVSCAAAPPTIAA